MLEYYLKMYCKCVCIIHYFNASVKYSALHDVILYISFSFSSAWSQLTMEFIQIEALHWKQQQEHLV